MDRRTSRFWSLGLMAEVANWVDKKTLLELLGIGKNYELELRRDGIFQPGTHYRRKSQVTTPSSPLLYDAAACDSALRAKAVREAQRFEVYDGE